MDTLSSKTDARFSFRPIKLVTCALPYANNHLHLGHMLEQIQADIWVRYLRLRSESVAFICGDDTHGTPIMLQARSEGISEERILEKYCVSHEEDSKAFGISFDHYDSTHEPHSQQMLREVYQQLVAAGMIYRKNIQQLYDVHLKMFLPDRMVKGHCPTCKAPEQYGDNCEQCGATYSAEQLGDPIAVLSQSKPEIRTSEHLFFDLKKFKDCLKEWLDGSTMQPPLVHKSYEWLTQGLLGWDISRDAPYFGVRIPGESEKFFYVWLDAVSGYLGASKALWKDDPQRWEAFWADKSVDELHQFIGKDISYFHLLFWPAILKACNRRLPTRVHAHGYLTIKKQKMSKSRKTFLFAKDFRAHLPAETLRYYLACKLNSRFEDIDFCLDDLIQRINSDLVGKVANLAARSSKFIHTYFKGKLSSQLTNEGVFEQVCSRFEEVGHYLHQLEYSKAVRLLLQFADEANSLFDRYQPWQAIKALQNHERVHAVCTEVLSIFRVIVLGLSPIIPEFSQKALGMFETENTWESVLTAPLNETLHPFSKLIERICPEVVCSLLE